ncbi:hypothetical protein EDB84DRAFT_1258119, partial [Lactarius hengduanensis]
VKTDSTKDILLLFSQITSVKFKKNDTYETVKGRWCNLCREDKELMKRQGLRRAFLKGSNSTCRQHARQHWESYKKRCEDSDIPVHHWAIPRPIWKEMEAEKRGDKHK